MEETGFLGAPTATDISISFEKIQKQPFGKHHKIQERKRNVDTNLCTNYYTGPQNPPSRYVYGGDGGNGDCEQPSLALARHLARNWSNPHQIWTACKLGFVAANRARRTCTT